MFIAAVPALPSSPWLLLLAVMIYGTFVYLLLTAVLIGLPLLAERRMALI
jgi:hypothetical protein